jgi:HPt (histidine-containing phosphotransfer) domain-containing protein
MTTDSRMPSSPHEPLDRDVLFERVDGDWDLIDTLLSLFGPQERTLLDALHAASAVDDMDGIARAAHGMASSFGTIGAIPVMRAAKALEMAARRADAGGVVDACACLEMERARLTGVLAALADECASHLSLEARRDGSR